VIAVLTALTAVEWQPPTVNGGSAIAGYQLLMGEFAGDDMRLVYDGVGAPGTTTFTVDKATNAPELVTGMSYRFAVRAVTFCSAAQPTFACVGAYSGDAVYTVRAPRAPQPPAQLVTSSLTTAGTPPVIQLLWSAPLDNGGAAVTSYNVYMKDQSSSVLALHGTVTAPSPTDDFAQLSYTTNTGISNGGLYTFYVQVSSVTMYTY
jgi:hypothetical protein